MELEKINVKFFVEDPGGIPLTKFIHVFTSWIRASEGAYVDVADYSHTSAGPGVVLVAHEANISMDTGGNRLGLLYNRKQAVSGTNKERLRATFRAALQICRRIEEEPALEGRVRFLGNEALFMINDRLLAPNTGETFQAVRPALEDLARTLYAGAPVRLEHLADPQKRFAVHITTPLSCDVASLLKNLGEAS